jgi:hypothetical protein
MNKFAIIAIAAALIAPSSAFAETTEVTQAGVVSAAAPVKITSGKMLYSTSGYRIAPIYRVNADGHPQVIVDGRLVTVPSTSISAVNGKITTTLTKKEIVSAK